jgi:small-conductance mechanosensitive channel
LKMVENGMNASNYTFLSRLEANKNASMQDNVSLRNLTQNILKNLDDKIALLQSSVSQLLNKDPCLEDPCRSRYFLAI